MKRTDQQNRALHLWLRQVADQLQEKHYDFRDIKVEVRPTEHLVKEYMWRPIQKALYGEVSTTELERAQVADVYDHLNKLLGERFAIHVPWPEDTKHD